MTRIRLPKVLLLAFFLSVSSAFASQAGAGPADSSASALEKDVPSMMKETQVPGVAIAIIRDGKTYWLHNFGVRDVNTKLPVTNDTVFNVGSLSKPVFAYGVLKLVDQGKLGLDVPLSTYLPKPYIEGDDRLQKITARIVLSHRTGFPNWRGNGPLKIYFTPGERFSYSGEGMVYLQKVVEQISGKPLNDYMQEAVFGPLGMTSSSYVWKKDLEDHIATGHDADGAPVPLFKPTEANAAASLDTSVRDYATFVEAVLAGKGLKPATLRDMETPQIAVDPACTNCTDRVPKELSKTVFWGLGWGIQQTSQGESLWHWGDNGVYKAYVVALPASRSGVVMFANGENGLGMARKVLAETVGGDQPALAWLKYDDYDSPAMRFLQAVHSQGANAALQSFSSALAGGAISEDTMNNEGYRLLAGKRAADAIVIFRKNVELHPESSNVYDSLGEAYMDDGQKEAAITNYEKSLQLNPNNSNAVSMLKKLRAPQSTAAQ